MKKEELLRLWNSMVPEEKEDLERTYRLESPPLVPSTFFQKEAEENKSIQEETLLIEEKQDTFDNSKTLEASEHIQLKKKSSPAEHLFSNSIPYEILEEISRGGMGVIYQGKQNSLQRKIAIKKLLNNFRLSKQKKSQFVAEAIVTAYLDHPNIVPVYDLAQNDQNDFIMTMKLVKGVSWRNLLHPKTESEKLLAKKYTLLEHLEVLISVCNAVAFAHSKNIVHNDIKPENIIIGEFGEVFVMDWGIAVDIQKEERNLYLAKKESIKGPMGTPRYMSPELASGNGLEIGPWTDVYLLGATLYEIMAKEPPHQGEHFWEVLLSIVEKKPPALSTSEWPQELIQICYKCLSKNPEDRYQTVLEFKEALKRFLEHRESILITQNAHIKLEECHKKNNVSLKSIKETKSFEYTEHSELYFELAQVVAGFSQALLLWDKNKEARRGKEIASFFWAKIAFEMGDLSLAFAQLKHLDKNNLEVQKLIKDIQIALQKKERTQQANERLKIGLIFTGILIVAGLLSIIWLVQYEQRQMALKYAQLYTTSLEEFRSIYSSQIVDQVEPHGIKITHQATESGEIPFPATFSIEFSKKISSSEMGFRARLYSDYPFPWRLKEGGPKDSFEREALVALRKNSEKPFIRYEDVNGISSLRFGRAVVFGQSCVDCHNSHPKSPKVDWKVGDVRGVEEIIIPLSPTTKRIKK